MGGCSIPERVLTLNLKEYLTVITIYFHTLSCMLEYRMYFILSFVSNHVSLLLLYFFHRRKHLQRTCRRFLFKFTKSEVNMLLTSLVNTCFTNFGIIFEMHRKTTNKPGVAVDCVFVGFNTCSPTNYLCSTN